MTRERTNREFFATRRRPRKLDLTFQVSTKLNRSHLVHGKQAVILPCLGRTEKDQQIGGHLARRVDRALRYDIPRGSAAGHMPEMNVLIGVADYRTPSDQLLMKGVLERLSAPAGCGEYL